MAKEAIEVDEVVIRFSGDSGDGMQLTGTQFSLTSALMGNAIATFPDYPAEIRAPQGSVSGVSGFQIQFGHDEVFTPGDFADVLVAMNPAAIKANIQWVKEGGTIIYDSDSFTIKNIKKAGYTEDPIEEENLTDYHLVTAPITSQTALALKDLGLDRQSIRRSRNMFALGMVYWLFNRDLSFTDEFLEEKFKKAPLIVEANKKVLRAGYYHAETIQAMPTYRVSPASISKGKYRNINGNQATTWGLIAASERSGLDLFVGSYPITPATDILQLLAARKDLGVKSFQAEDEIAGISAAIGASFAGDLGVTSTSGPGLALKGEAIGLAVITELPLVIINVQRGGPSTGLPTKPEQADLMQALYGRNGESPVVVMAASSPTSCFRMAYWASKIAVEHMTPVILLSDGFIANGSAPWKYPKVADMPAIVPPIVRENGQTYLPYERDPDKMSRQWAIPGTIGKEHRLGSLEKSAGLGEVSYDPENHERMVFEREKKVQQVANYIPELKIQGATSGDLLVIGWGGTSGHLRKAVNDLVEDGHKIGLAHFDFINPLPKNTAEVLSGFKKRVVCELNLGQFVGYLRMKFPQFDYKQYNKVQGLPFTVIELKKVFEQYLD